MRLSGLVRRVVVLLLASLCGWAAAETPQGLQFGAVGGRSGWMLQGNRLFWTDSLGAKWIEISPEGADVINGVAFHADGNGWLAEIGAGGAVTVARTADNGAHWATSAIASPFTDARPANGRSSLSFSDAQHGLLMLGVQSSSAFRPGILLSTVDGGKTWAQMPAPPVGGDVTMIDASHALAGPGPEGDELYATADAGMTWKRVELASSSDLALVTSSIADPVFSDATHGSLLRTYSTAGAPTVVRYTTADGGATWSAAGTETASTLVALTKDGGVARSSAAKGVPAAAMAQRSSFGSSTEGFVLFSSGGCRDGVCTQTESLRATLDGGQTFFAPAPAAGVEMDSAKTVPAAAVHPCGVNPDSSTVYNTAGVMGFDACSLPTTAQLQDWITNSPYRVVGVYIGGANYANCTQSLSKLNAAYVSTVLGMGWQIIPIWVGPQGVGACSGCTTISSPSQGTTEADSATAAAAALGIGQGTPIVYDMEAYTRGGTNTTTTQNFIDAWDTEMHAKGYIAGVYSSHPEFTDWYPTVVTPAIDTIWFAYFFSTGVACGTECQTVFPTQGSFDISASYWLNNHRARQTSSGFNSTYGTTTINIDEDWVDAAMATATPNTLTLAKTTGGSVASSTITNPNGDATTDTAISCGLTCTSATATFAPTDTVVLAATPSSGLNVSWKGCTSVSANNCSVLVATSETVTASFGYTLNVVASGIAPNVTTSSDGDINCGGSPSVCSFNYPTGTTVTLTTTVPTGYVLTGWTGCTTTSGATCTVLIGTAGVSVTPNFSTATTLTVSKTGSGTGTITSSDSKINCGTTCSASYAPGSVVTLTAAAGANSTFVSWTGCTTTSGATCTVTVGSTAVAVSAVFSGPNTLTVTKAGTGSGMVTSADGGINCGSTCSASYAANTVVTLTAVAGTNNTFTSWTGCTTSTGTTCTVTMAAAEAVTATFTGPNTLTVAKAGTGSGTVTSADGGINCGSTCSASYAANTVVTLTATAAANNSFTGWTGCTTSSGTTCTVTMAAAETVTATFTGPVTLTVTAGTGGSVTSSPAGISCGSTCTASYAPGTVVTLTEAASSGYVFGSWSSNCTVVTATTCTITLSASATVTASFTTAPVPGFSSALSQPSLTLAPGASSSGLTVNITTVNGWAGTFGSFACSGQPATVTCAFNPTTVTATATTTTYAVGVTVSVPSTISMVAPPSRSRIEWAGLLLPALLTPLAFRRRMRSVVVKRLAVVLFAVGLLGAMQALSGCGGGSSSSSSTPTGPIFSGTMNVTFTGTPTTGTSINNTDPISLTISR